MAKIDLLLQAVTDGVHANALQDLLADPLPAEFIASIAFVRLDGVNVIADRLEAMGGKAAFFAGIRNDITSVQAMRRLVELGVEVYAVDTASRAAIYHPKLFLAKRSAHANAVIGSANLTFSGLHNNIEAGALVALNLKNPDDRRFVETTTRLIRALPRRFPKHVTRLRTLGDVEQLFVQGRLADEEVVLAPCVGSSTQHHQHVQLPPMVKSRTRSSKARSLSRNRAVKQDLSEFQLVWQSKALTERDLNVPSGNNTHATGGMGWKKGAMEDLDQRHDFRGVIFAGLDWQPKDGKPHHELAWARFHLVVVGVRCGAFDLQLTHNTDTSSASYRQNNHMTSIHWGKGAKVWIQRRDLLGRVMSLYRRDSTPPEFLIEID